MPCITPLDFEEEIRQFNNLTLPRIGGSKTTEKSRGYIANRPRKSLQLPPISSKTNGGIHCDWQRHKRKVRKQALGETSQEEKEKLVSENRKRPKREPKKMAGMETKSYVIFSDESGENYRVIQEEASSFRASKTPETDPTMLRNHCTFSSPRGTGDSCGKRHRRRKQTKGEHGLVNFSTEKTNKS